MALDRASSSADVLHVVQTRLQVSRRTERLFGNETTPIMYGGRNWSAANYRSVTTALYGSPSLPWWIGVVAVFHAKAGGGFQTLVSKVSNSVTNGITIYTSGTNAVLNMYMGSGSAWVNAPTYSIPDGELGKPLLFGYQWTGSVLQAFVKRSKLGSDIAATAFVPYSGSLMVGRNSDTTGNPASDNVSVLGVMGGNATLTLPEWQAAYDAFVSEEDLIAVPGKTSRLWSEKRAQSGGAMQNITDAQGSGEVLSIVGAPALSSINYRAIAA
jgi:hypothetical protein